MGARAARYLNPGTRRLLEDPQLAGPERSPNGAAEASDLCPVRVLPWAGLPLLPVRFLMALLRRPTVSGPATLRTGLGPAALPAPPPFASLFPRLRTSSQPAPLSSSCGRPGPWPRQKAGLGDSNPKPHAAQLRLGRKDGHRDRPPNKPLLRTQGTFRGPSRGRRERRKLRDAFGPTGRAGLNQRSPPVLQVLPHCPRREGRSPKHTRKQGKLTVNLLCMDELLVP